MGRKQDFSGTSRVTQKLKDSNENSFSVSGTYLSQDEPRASYLTKLIESRSGAAGLHDDARYAPTKKNLL